jgi:hypothetical protein
MERKSRLLSPFVDMAASILALDMLEKRRVAAIENRFYRPAGLDGPGAYFICL